MGGAGAGASAGAAAAGVPGLNIFLAIAGAAFGAHQAQRANKALRKATTISQRRIDEMITQARVNRLLRTAALAREAQTALGAALNVAPSSLSALETIRARIVSGAASDQFAIDQEIQRQEAAFQAEKENVVAAAISNNQNVLLAGLSGAVSGFGAGTDVSAGLAEIQQRTQQAASAAALAASQTETQRLFRSFFTQDQRQFEERVSRVGANLSNIRFLRNTFGLPQQP
jgi:hypothetical protein